MNEVIKSLLPPEDNPVKRWRQAIAAVVILLVFAVASGFGMFSWLGFSGFARASDLDRRVSAVEENVKDIKISLIEQSLFDAKESECASTDLTARRFFSQRVLALGREYFDLAKTTLSVPPCRD